MPRLGRACDGAATFVADTVIDIRGQEWPGPIRLHSNIGPIYPSGARAAGKEGRVIVSFAIDSTGRVPKGTVFIQSETNLEFGNSVCTWLRLNRFDPVVIDGRIRSLKILNSPVNFSLMQ